MESKLMIIHREDYEEIKRKALKYEVIIKNNTDIKIDVDEYLKLIKKEGIKL